MVSFTGICIYIAEKFKTKGISLIAGIEYYKREAQEGASEIINGIVSNQLVYILNIEHKGFSAQFCIIQEKTRAAENEERELFDLGGKVLAPMNRNKYVINHNGFIMSGLICNDLLNIDYRQALRGRIDALVVVEWNKDIKTYNSIVSATANDLHCFIVQVNNRQFGDTRLRGPYKKDYKRDIVRVRGGELDYFVVATLDVSELREFQDHHRSPSGPFKPMPTGYRMAENRRPK